MLEGIASRTSDSLHETVLEALPDPVMVHDYDTILYANPAALSALKATQRDQVIGMPVDTFTHEQSRQSGEERRTLVMQHGVWISGVCIRLTACNGTDLKVTGDAGRLDYNGGHCVIVIGREVIAAD